MEKWISRACVFERDGEKDAMILVTGGTGFLGGHLLDLLATRGEPIRCLCRTVPRTDPRPVEWLQGDVTQPKTLAPAMVGVRHVYHVAGRVDFNPPAGDRLLMAVNETGTRNVLEAASNAGVAKVVHVSSVSTIGGTTDPARPLREADFGKGTGTELPYPSSKRHGEMVALEYARRGFPVTIVNPTFFAGPGDLHLSSARTILSFIKRQVWVGLNRGGMGYTDVRDIAAGLVAAMEKGVSGERYILGGHNLRLHEYHALLARVTGLSAPKLRVSPWLAMLLAHLGSRAYRMVGITPYVRAGDVKLARNYWLYDYSRATQDLGLSCRPAEQSLRDTVAWLLANGYCKPWRQLPPDTFSTVV